MVDRFCFFAKHCPSHSVRSPILEKKKNKKPKTRKKKKETTPNTLLDGEISNTHTPHLLFCKIEACTSHFGQWCFCRGLNKINSQ